MTDFIIIESWYQIISFLITLLSVFSIIFYLFDIVDEKIRKFEIQALKRQILDNQILSYKL